MSTCKELVIQPFFNHSTLLDVLGVSTLPFRSSSVLDNLNYCPDTRDHRLPETVLHKIAIFMKFGDVFHKYELHSFVTMVTYWVSSLSDIGFSGHLWLSILYFSMVPQLHVPAINEYVRSKLWPQVRGYWTRVSCHGKMQAVFSSYQPSRRSVWANLDQGPEYRPNAVRSVYKTAVKILHSD